VEVALEGLISSHGVFHTTMFMWLPTRTQSVPPHAVYGYSINTVDGSRFPSDGSFAVYNFDGYQSLYEALDTVGVEQQTDITELDFLPKKKSTWQSFNPVQHYKRMLNVTDGTFAFFSRESGVKYRNYGIPVLSFWDGNYCNLALSPVAAFGPVDNPILGLPVLWEGLVDGCYHSDQGLYGLACQNMLPGIRPASSLINSIYELKDVKTIPHTLAKIGQSLSNLEKLLKGEAKYLFANGGRASRKTLKSIVNAGADVYLQNSFNIQPLLQDITNVVFSVDRVEKKLKQLLAQANQPVRTHWGCELDGFKSNSSTRVTTGRPSDSDTNVSLTRDVAYSVARFQATLEYSYAMPEGSYAELRTRGIIDYNGLVLSPQVIWNAIPWSFVVDWVVGVGPWLSQFTGRQLDIVTHISKGGWSVKIDREIKLSSSLTGQVAMLHEVSYFRKNQMPPLISSLRTSGLNPKEFSLGAALGVSHV